MMSLLRFTILVIFGVVTSQNHDGNSQINIKITQGKVETPTACLPDLTIDNEETQLILSRLETLLVEKLDYLITDTNKRFQYLEDHIENLETKAENLGKNIQELMDATRNLPSDVEAIKRNVSSLINATRSLEDISPNSDLKQIFNKGLQEIKDFQTSTSTSCQFNVTIDKQYPRNCREVRKFEKTTSGNYMIQPQHAPKPFEAVCDLETRGGGWTVIQKRFDGSQDFYLGWDDYKKGFGNLGGEFWLGLEHIHLLTGFEVNELLIELGDFESNNKTAIYSQFSVGPETEGYAIKVLGGYSGDAGDSFDNIVGMKFTTKDNDQDAHKTIQCAEFHGGGWWYHQCGYTNLNGKYFRRGQEPGNIVGIFWYYFNNYSHWYSLKYSRMLVRPRV